MIVTGAVVVGAVIVTGTVVVAAVVVPDSVVRFASEEIAVETADP